MADIQNKAIEAQLEAADKTSGVSRKYYHLKEALSLARKAKSGYVKLIEDKIRELGQPVPKY